LDSFCVNSCPVLLLRQLVEDLHLCEAVSATLWEGKPTISRWKNITHYLLSAQSEVTKGLCMHLSRELNLDDKTAVFPSTIEFCEWAMLLI